jgi:hypothetical protein
MREHGRKSARAHLRIVTAVLAFPIAATVCAGQDVVDAEEGAVEAALRAMTSHEQIAQLLSVSFQGTAMSADLTRSARDHRVGGAVARRRVCAQFRAGARR